MISLGRNIRQPNDRLEKIPLDQLVGKIRNPKQKFIDFIVQLRRIQTIDVKKYRELKTKLPYVVAATFNPAYRKIDNFAFTQYFILDLDHLSDKEIDINLTTEKLKADPRVVLIFRSPSNDGLKLFFKFTNPFYDAGKYTLFYKLFAQKFATDYSINQVVDKQTSDVSRACFVSYDPEAWFNNDAKPIDADKYINFDNQLQVIEIEHQIKKSDKEQAKNKIISDSDITKQDLDSLIIKQIRERLNPKLIIKREKQIFVPKELDSIIDLIKSNLTEYGFEIEDIVNISYGKQFRIKIQHLKAEINIFYGKRGFTVVKSSKSGMNTELVNVAHDIIANILN